VEDALIRGFAFVALLGGLGVAVVRSPAAAGTALVITLFAVSGICMVLDAHLLAVLLVVAWAGAVLVLMGLETRLGAHLSARVRFSPGLVGGLGAVGLLGAATIGVMSALEEADRGAHTLAALGPVLLARSHLLSLVVSAGIGAIAIALGLALARWGPTDGVPSMKGERDG